MAILTVHHVTTYEYRRAVAFGEHRIMFRPRDSYYQRLLDAQMVITPKPHDVRWVLDVFGNCVAVVRFKEHADTLRFDCLISLDHQPVRVTEFPIEEAARRFPFDYGEEELPDLARFMQRQWPDEADEITTWARQFLDAEGRAETWDLLRRMTETIKATCKYVARFEMGVQTPQTTLALKQGTCRDFALLMMEAARSLGLAARFVSGYLHVPRKTARSRIGGGSTHAWLEVYLPGAGWVEFDPTNGIVGNQDLIRVAVTRSPAQASPIQGTWIGFPGDDIGMTVQVHVFSQETADIPMRGTMLPIAPTQV